MAELTAEEKRLAVADTDKKLWRKWGPYLSERQWGTVREDYSPDGSAWDYFPHDHARSRTYRWGEDGIAGISDRFMNLCFSVAFWNGKDPIIKERLFGLTGPDGNHGEDCKELYYYLDNLPSHAYMKYLYKYPQGKFPYSELLQESKRRGKTDREYELLDTGVFDEDKYFDITIEYCKNSEEDIFIKVKARNVGPEAAELHLIPTLWFRNLWSFGLTKHRPYMYTAQQGDNWGAVKAEHHRIGNFFLYYEQPDKTLFTENETNMERVFNTPNRSPYVKDAINDAIVNNDYQWVTKKHSGTKFSPLYVRTIASGETQEIKLRLSEFDLEQNPFEGYEAAFEERISEADQFYSKFIPENLPEDLKKIQRQAFAGMLWSKQYYEIDVESWLEGDPGQPKPPESRKKGRNKEWKGLYNKDIISMPDKWEYPWYAAWDLAFHCVPLAMIDPTFAKNQLITIMREWYMAPNGQIPAYEWAFGDVNPPVQAWAVLKVYHTEHKHYGIKDVNFLKRAFSKLMLNFTWWVNRKDSKGKNVFEGGFLGLDNIGIFDRSNRLPGGGRLEQADGTSWMAMFSLNMMQMALEICQYDTSFEDVATKFYEHFVLISESLNKSGNQWVGAWDEEGGFFYDVLQLPDKTFIRLKIHSLVGLTPLYGVSLVEKEKLKDIPDFIKRLKWFRKYRLRKKKFLVIDEFNEGEDILFSLIPKERVVKLIQAMIDESEFLAPGGIRSLSKRHEKRYSISIEGEDYSIDYEPGESNTELFGGNSNWRGPVWFPTNYLLIEALREYHKYYGESLKLEFPKGSGELLNLKEIANKICDRLIGIFRVDENGERPVPGKHPFSLKENNKDLILFYEYFHGENSRGIGASHQTGWTGIVAKLIGSLPPNYK